MSKQHHLWTVVLAAGGSRRLGRPKQLLKHTGRALLLRAVEQAERTTPGRVVVVLGAHAPLLRVVMDRAGLLPAGAGFPVYERRTAFAGFSGSSGGVLTGGQHGLVRIVRNPGWRSGMAGSLRSGLAALPHNATAALILLADQPDIGDASLQQLVAAWRQDPARASAARYAGRAGVPAILPKTWWREVMKLRADEGARKLLANAESLHAVAMPEAATDIDSVEDAAALAARQLSGSRGPHLPGRRKLRKRRSRS
jgi:molybdenum cofactor cytidylyltransferase